MTQMKIEMNMKTLLCSIFALAMATAANAQDGGTADAGTAADAGATAPADGGGNGGGGTLGTDCSTDADCSAGEICFDLFQGQGQATCFATCAEGETTCTGPQGLAGGCAQLQGQDATLCIVQSGNLGPCGNPLSAACASPTQLCLLPQGEPIGICGTPCNPTDPTTCNAAVPQGADCGCAAGMACSTDLQLQASPQNDGVCATPTTAGDTCGMGADFTLTACTNGQSCSAPQGGTCQAGEDPANNGGGGNNGGDTDAGTGGNNNNGGDDTDAGTGGGGGNDDEPGEDDPAEEEGCSAVSVNDTEAPLSLGVLGLLSLLAIRRRD